MMSVVSRIPRKGHWPAFAAAAFVAFAILCVGEIVGFDFSFFAGWYSGRAFFKVLG